MKLFTKGARVTQPTYGPGTVTSSDDRYTVIEFDNHGKRTFLTDMVVLGATDEPAPARAKTRARAPRAKKAAG
jgi:hypothetical protein